MNPLWNLNPINFAKWVSAACCLLATLLFSTGCHTHCTYGYSTDSTNNSICATFPIWNATLWSGYDSILYDIIHFPSSYHTGGTMPDTLNTKKMKDYIFSLHTDPKSTFVEIQQCFTLAGCSLNSFYQLAGQKVIILMTHIEPQPETHRSCDWNLEASSNGLYHLAMWQWISVWDKNRRLWRSLLWLWERGNKTTEGIENHTDHIETHHSKWYI